MEMHRYLLFFFLLSLTIAAARGNATDPQPAFTSVRFPKVTLTNGMLQILVLLPDAAHGYYRGPRFDWSGMVAQATYHGHTFFGEWKTPHDSVGNDDVVGPADEFGMGYLGATGPLGYTEAKPGENFLKIGVGLQRKIEEAEYDFYHNYQIITPGTWKIRHDRSWIEFHQELSDGRGYGYSYMKKISLPRGRPEMVITHTLKNTGTKPINTSYYCHNFTRIDEEPLGPSYVVRFPFSVTTKSDIEHTAIQDYELHFPTVLKPDESIFLELSGSSQAVRDNTVTVENVTSHAGVKIQGDQPVQYFHFFGVSSAACPEPFLDIHLAPGEQTEWGSTYTFFETPTQ